MDPALIILNKHIPQVAACLLDPINGTQQAVHACEVEKTCQCNTNPEEDDDNITTAINPVKCPAESTNESENARGPSGAYIVHFLSIQVSLPST